MLLTAADHRSSAYLQSPGSGPALIQRALVSTMTAALACVFGSHAGGCWLLLEQTYLDWLSWFMPLFLLLSWQSVNWHPSWAVSWGCWRWDTLLPQMPWPGEGKGKGGHMLDVNNSNCLWSLEFHFLILSGFEHIHLRSPPNCSLFCQLKHCFSSTQTSPHIIFWKLLVSNVF